MINEKLKELLDFYFTYIVEHESVTLEQTKFKIMCLKASDFAAGGKINKAIRMLGVIQGILYSRGHFSLEELKIQLTIDQHQPRKDK